MTDTRTGDVPQFTAVALEGWARHVDAVLQGIAHSLNNRAAALSAAIQLTRDEGGQTVVDTVLSPELARITELATAVKMLGAPRAGMEAFPPKDAAAEAGAILRLHAEHRNRIVAFETRGSAPVRVQRWMFVRALVALAADHAGAGDATVTIADDADWVVARAPGIAPSAYVAELAAAMGGATLEDGFRIPTLAALRRREGR